MTRMRSIFVSASKEPIITVLCIHFFAGRIHHSLAVKASDYKKKQYVFRLTTADYAEYLFQTGYVSVSA